MRLYKRELGKLFLVTWKDARSQYLTTVADFVKKGFAIKESVGWLKYYDKDMIVLASERCEEEYDLTMIIIDWVIEMVEQKEIK